MKTIRYVPLNPCTCPAARLFLSDAVTHPHHAFYQTEATDVPNHRALLACFSASVPAFAQTLDGTPYTPGKDPDIDLFIGSWTDSMPRQSHGSLVERDILTKGDPLKPPRKGAALKYVNRFVHATLEPNASTTSTTLKGEQKSFIYFPVRES